MKKQKFNWQEISVSIPVSFNFAANVFGLSLADTIKNIRELCEQRDGEHLESRSI